MSTQPIQLVPKAWTEHTRVRRREYLWVKAEKKCHWCGIATRLVDDNSWDKATVDHVIPRYKHGTNDPANLVHACNRCNNRRNHEDHLGLPDGHLLGQFKAGQMVQSTNTAKGKTHNPRHIALSGDEKRAIMGKAHPDKSEESARIMLDTVKLQRDHALQIILQLRKEIKQKDESLKYADEMMKSITISKLIRKRIGTWLLT